MVEAEKQFFRELDTGFVGFEEQDLAFSWKCTGMFVQWKWYVDIPVQVPGSVLRYEFSTEGNDISFGVEFFGEAPGMDKEVRQLERVDSHVEAVVGRHKILNKGTVRLTWDNSYSWLTGKTLTYAATLQLPDAGLADEARATRARSSLVALHEDALRAKLRLQRCQESGRALQQEVPQLRARLAALQEQLAHKESAMAANAREAEDLVARMEADAARVPGLCIRSLTRDLLRRVLLGLEPHEAALVSKYWRAVAAPPKAGSNGAPA